MILDNAIPHSVVISDAVRQKLKIFKPYTRRFIFDEDASHKLGRFSWECIDIVCRNTRFAIPPFKNTYIEIDNLAYFRGVGQEVETDAAERLGFLWTEDGVCYIVAGNDHRADFNPYTYVPVDSPEPVKLGNYCYALLLNDPVIADKTEMTHEKFRRMLMVGGIPERLQKDADKFVPQMTSLWDVGLASLNFSPPLLEGLFYECAGSFKRAIAALLLLDERSKRHLVQVNARQKIVMGKLKAIARHELVTIDLDMPLIRKVYTGAPVGHHETPIEHEVREHWMHFDVSSQCTHEWEPYTSISAEEYDRNTPPFKPLRREICSLCGGRRTRKRSYVAGDASKGSNIGKTKYKVIASKEPKS